MTLPPPRQDFTLLRSYRGNFDRLRPLGVAPYKIKILAIVGAAARAVSRFLKSRISCCLYATVIHKWTSFICMLVVGYRVVQKVSHLVFVTTYGH